jgi:hypothetical protein
MEPVKSKGRIQEIDIAKGMACFLMVAAHFISAKILPFGTLAAPIFFACSGMNTILLLEKTKGNKRYELFHLLFPLLLFFGGSTLVVIAHGGRLRVSPGFLQCIALAVLVLFLLSRAFRNPFHVGALFPVPFLVQQFLPLSVLRSVRGTPLIFLFGNGFALFPWLGFFLFGVFLLRLKRNSLPWLLAALSSAFVLSFALGGVPLQKFWMSVSYMLLALAAVTLAFLLARWIAGRIGPVFFNGLAELFALPGRNALMFVYLHYFALRNLATADFFPSFHLYILFETLYLFLACNAFLTFYEKVKTESALFFPAAALFMGLFGLRWGGLLKPRADLRLVDLTIGILFAFLYVLLRRRMAARCDRLPGERSS